MKRKTYPFSPLSFLLLLSILTLSFKTVYAQWIKLFTDTKENLNDVVMLDSTSAIVVGSGGSILKTTDSGKTWNHKELIFSMLMNWNCSSFCDKLNGVVAGRDYIFTTTNGGENWSPIHFNGGKNFTSILCLNLNNIFAGDDSGYVYQSNDSGKTWKSEKLSVTPINSIFSYSGPTVNALKVYALSNDSLFIKSEYPASSWTNWGNLGYFNGLGSSAFKGGISDKGTFFIVGVQGDLYSQATIIRLRPQDSHWYSVGPPSGTGELFGLSIPSDKFIYTCGMAGKILKSSDSGDDWILQATPTTQRLNSISFYNNEKGFAVGDSGTILYTKNGGDIDTGESEQLIPFGLQGKVITCLTGEESYNYFPNNFNSIFAGTQEDGVFSKSITTSPDSGWNSLGLEYSSITALTVQHWGVGPADGLRLYAAVIPKDKQIDSTLIFSKEVRLAADTNWSKSDNGLNKNLNRINTLNSYYYTGQTPPQPLLAGTNLGIFSSRQKYWNQSDIKELNIQPKINSIDIDSHWESTLAWAVGNTDLSPLAFRSTDRGMTWKAITLTGYLGASATSIAINPRHTDSVYISWNNTILLTPDNGETWESVFSSRGVYILTLAIDLLNPENVFAGGWFFDDSYQTPDHGVFLHSTNGGEYWDEPEPNIDKSLKEVTSLLVMKNPIDNASNVFIGTKGTGIWQYKYSILTNTNESKNSPSKFILYQNYPNPFNPTTKIKYSIPFVKMGDALSVQLKVYDILGREIATLVNKKQSSGEYLVEFDTKKYNLSSGIYFYQLKSNNFILTKKMIVIK